MDSIGSYGSSGSVDFAKMRQEMFRKIDSDGDGQFSLEEFEAAKPANAPEAAPAANDIFAEMDADSDGSVTEEEFLNAAPPAPPLSGGMGMMGSDMLSTLLEALEARLTSSSDDEDRDNTTASATDEETETSEVTEEDILKLVQQEMEKYRNLAFSQASSAYSDAGSLNSILASQQQTLASL